MGSQRVRHDWANNFHFQGYEGCSQVLLVVKNPPANAVDARDLGSITGLGRSPEVGNSNPLARKTPWTRSVEGYSPWGWKESDTTDHTNTRGCKAWALVRQTSVLVRRALVLSPASPIPHTQERPCEDTAALLELGRKAPFDLGLPDP